ncbi:hypothetical protein [Paenibacillus sp. Aloe-11]|uniref:hypothetical protein n=1 Tax=Paenibacillus sp. Aloe-11 TaxID=1050222 RepID=UPI0012F4E33A|nr:hypothetical protein [Paenibacillus sp. Aloe-11]
MRIRLFWNLYSFVTLLSNCIHTISFFSAFLAAKRIAWNFCAVYSALTIQNTTVEIAEPNIQDVPTSAITRFETQGNPNARVEFVDPKLVQKNSVITPQAGDRRVYVKSEYSLGSNKITGYSVGPIQKQTLIISVAKGRTATRSSSLTVSGTVSITATVDANIAYIVKESLICSYQLRSV